MHCRSTKAVVPCAPKYKKKKSPSLRWKFMPKGIHHAEFLCSFWLVLNTVKMLVGKRFNLYSLSPLNMPYIFYSHKASNPCKILNVDFSSWLCIWKWLLSLFFSFGFLVFKCFIWRGLITECSGHFVWPQPEPLYNGNQI